MVNIWHRCDYSLPGFVGGPGFYWISASAHILPHFSLLPSHAPFFFSSLNDHSIRRHSSAHESSHWLEFDSSSQRGGQTGWSQPFHRKTICQCWAGGLVYVTTQLLKKKEKAHSGIIFTLLLYFPNAPPRERVKKCVLKALREEKWAEGMICSLQMHAFTVAARPPKHVCENTNPSLGQHIFLHRWS